MENTKQYQLGLWQVVSLGIGSIVGAGIFALLGQVLQETGEMTYYSFAISGVIALFCGYAYIKLAGAFPSQGGITVYFQHAFPNKWISGTLTLIYVFTTLISAGTMAKSFGFYMDSLLGHLPFLSVNVWAAGLLILLGLFNMMKANDVGNAEALMVAFKVGILTILIIAGFVEFKSYTPAFTTEPSTSAFFRSIGITFFAFAGFGVITNATAYVKNKEHTIRRAMYLTILLVMTLYIGLSFVVINYISPTVFAQNVNVAVAVVAKQLLGDIGSLLIYAAAILAFFTGVSASYFAVFRITKSLAEQNILPTIYRKKLFGRGTYGNGLSIILLTAITVLFGFNDIVNLSSVAYLVSYLGVFAASFILRKQTHAKFIPISIGFVLMSLLLIGFVKSVYL